LATKASPLDVKLGMKVYVSDTPRIGGRIRSELEDFIVEEVLLDGSKASVHICMDEHQILGRGGYLICILIKKGCDTLTAIEKISRCIGVGLNRIGFAGIKDAQALTAQYVSIGAVSPERARINLGDICLIPIRFSRSKISTKILLGNQFDIMVRSILHSLAETRERISETWREISDLGGVPNFFGHQRFGTIRPITHLVGKFIIKGEFEEAAMLFLSRPSEHESPQARGARENLLETLDFHSALKIFPRSLTYERLMLRYLSKYPRDFLGALRRLPLKLRRLFVQAYQSYLFNRFLSERIEKNLPLNRVMKGDYVIKIGERGLPTSFSAKVEKENLHMILSEIEKGKMALALPIVGFDQELSGGIQGEIEREILEQEGVHPRDFKIEKMLESSMGGGLRRALSPVMDLSFTTEGSEDDTVARFKFALYKGSYATVVLREFMKPEDPVSSGF